MTSLANLFGSSLRRAARLVRPPATTGPVITAGVVALHPARILYFPIKKVANSSIKGAIAELMRDELGAFYNPDKPHAPFRTNDGVAYLRERKVILRADQIAPYLDYFKFAVVRNPYDRLVSCYAQKIRGSDFQHRDYIAGVARPLHRCGGFTGDMTFPQFVDRVCEIPDSEADGHFASQHLFFTDRKGRVLVDRMCRFEQLQDEFKAIFHDRVGARHLELPHMLKSRRKDADDYYDAETRRKVARRFARDFELLGYEP